MKTVLVDTNICYDIFVEDSKIQEYYSNPTEQLRFIINLHIIGELVILCRIRKEEAILFRILDPLLQGAIFNIEPIHEGDVQRATMILKKYRDKKLSFTDCLILTQAANNNWLVWTNDKEMTHTKECLFLEPELD
jgi:predicted nucleic acid-binding protein